MINPIKAGNFHYMVSKLREFFNQRYFFEAHTQSNLSVLSACENPDSVVSYVYCGKVWPQPQTGQMELEKILLNDKNLFGVYTISTSFRDEANDINYDPNRHDLIFPMFEFEFRGDIGDLMILERDLVGHLGFDSPCHSISYSSALVYLNCNPDSEIKANEEALLGEYFGNAVQLTHFPEYTNPFWNMKREGNISKKINVLLYGLETIGSSERSCDPDKMRGTFYSIKEGAYANNLFHKFTKEAVVKELEEFLSLDFFPRSGGGIGLTRLNKALIKLGVLD